MNTGLSFRFAPTAALLMGALSQAASAAPTVYEMRLTTTGGIGGGGIAGMFSMITGGSSTSRSMDLRLISPADLPAAYEAAHIVPETMGIGPRLPLRGERRSGGGGSGGETGELDGRVLIYWGGSATIG